MSTTAPDPQIEVTPPTRRQVYGQEVQLQKIFRAVDDATGREAERARREKVAVLVCHGMGQQVPFEHIDVISDAITRGPGRDLVLGNVQVCFATLGHQRLPRAEIRLDMGDREREVHVYEAYWAPLTEGKVSALDVTRFLSDAGFRGIEYALRGHFDRWMMGCWRPFRLGAGTLVSLACALTVVYAALLLYGALGLVFGVRVGEFLLGGAVTPARMDLLTAGLMGDLLRSPLLLALLLLPVVAATWLLRVLRGQLPYRVLGAVLLLAGGAWAYLNGFGPALLGTLLGMAALAAAGGLAWRFRSARTAASVGGAAAVALWTVLSGVAVATDVLRTLFPDTPALDGFRGYLALPAAWATGLVPGDVARALGASFPFQLLFLVSAVVLCLLLRGFYIQFLGDVAVYLSSHRLNEFDALRAEIRKVGMEAGCAIYGALDEDDGRPEYDGVVVVGHSLGSVVAYDTLNAILNRDVALGGKLGAEERTLRLITFGSPLDKSAFIFRTQKERSEVREALSAAVQPLIESPSARRNIPWVNIHSRLDPISGTVDYYDPPLDTRSTGELPGHRDVVNLRDPDAAVYGSAHTSYWTNPLLAEQLFEAVTAPVNTPG